MSSRTDTRLKFLAAVPLTNGLGEAGAFDDPSWPRYVRTTDIAGPRSLRGDVFASLPPGTAKKALLARGDILMTAAGATIGKSTTYLESGPACYAGFLVRFRPRPDVDGSWIGYWMQSQPYWDQINLGAVRSTIDNFSASKYANMRISVPPLEVQRRVAHFLDDQVALIDRAIHLRQQQVSLLRSRLQDQVDRLGDLEREKGAAVRAGLVLSVLPGYAFASSDFSDRGSYRLLRGVNVGVGTTRWDDVAHWDGDDPSVVARFRLVPGDVVLGMDRPWIGAGLRIARLTDADLPALLLQRVAKLSPGPRLTAEYVYWVFQAASFRRLVESQLTGLSVPHLSGEQIESYRFTLPNTPEQERLSAELSALNDVVTVMESQVAMSLALLQERKQALITAAVTGEFDVTTATARAV